MKLIIDKGNTRTKVAVYEKEELLSVTAVGRLDIGFIDDLFAKYDKGLYFFISIWIRNKGCDELFIRKNSTFYNE